MPRPTHIIRTICGFSKYGAPQTAERVDGIAARLEGAGWTVQTKRICTPIPIRELTKRYRDEILTCAGTLSLEKFQKQFEAFIESPDISVNVDLTNAHIGPLEAETLFKLIRSNPKKTFDSRTSSITPLQAHIFLLPHTNAMVSRSVSNQRI